MTLPILADGAALLAACFAWRVSKPIGAAIALAVLASLVHARTGIEALRWSSALVGLVGAVGLGRRAQLRAANEANLNTAEAFVQSSGLRGAEVWRDLIAQGARRYRLGRPDAIAVLCIASMAGDGASMLAWRHLGEWVQPVAQTLVSALMIAVCVWPRRRS